MDNASMVLHKCSGRVWGFRQHGRKLLAKLQPVKMHGQMALSSISPLTGVQLLWFNFCGLFLYFY